MPTFSMPGTCCRTFLVFAARTSNLSRSGPMILTELSPLMPERASITLSRMFCEKFQVMPGSLAVELVVHRVDDFVLGSRAHRAEDELRSPTSRSSLTSFGQSFSGRSGTKYSLL